MKTKPFPIDELKKRIKERMKFWKKVDPLSDDWQESQTRLLEMRALLTQIKNLERP